ncbi:MAG: prolyl oligopeptidase family serine peptidase [Planctomycetota bacterium]|nr:prolyl oligopeptidase family serine peptidase [Planctomycetota bacterium]
MTQRSMSLPISGSCAVALLFAACHTGTTMRTTEAEPLRPVRPAYPQPERAEVVDDYHGTRVADPYRGLEDPDSAPTVRWIEAQNALTREYVDAVPQRAAIEARLSALWNYERLSPPSHEGGLWFWSRNDGLQNQSVILVSPRPGVDGRVLLDPNTLRADGTISVTSTSASKDGRYFAYLLSEAGSDWNSVRVKETATGRNLPDKLQWIKFSGVSWAPDASGFYYSTYPEHDTSGTKALANHTLYFHRLGTAQEDDVIVHARPDEPEWGFGAQVTDDGELLVITQTQGTEQKNRVHLKSLKDPAAPVVKLFDAFDAEYNFLAKRGPRLWFQTDKGAARGRIVAVDVTAPDQLIEVVPEGRDAIEGSVAAGGKLVVTYLVDAANELRVYALDGRDLGRIETPPLGSVGVFAGDFDVPEAFFSYTSTTAPSEIWRWDARTGKAERFWSPKVPFATDEYVTERSFYASRDGTRIPLYVSRRRDVPLTKDTPCILYGYGGFNVAIKPAFSPGVLAWLEMGGSYAVANIRGGSEYGREWHEAGTKERKQNVFDDFIAAAEHLISVGWTSSPKLAIRGGSNGGLLVGACMTQRPELYGAALPAVGVLDMLRYHRFTIGWAWASDYGRADDPRAFPYLAGYSPLHNLKPGTCYPPTLVTTGQHDDRVVPAHSFKFAAALQAAQGCDNPCLIRVETRGGHGAGKPTALQIEELADQWAFLVRALRFTPRASGPRVANHE